MGIDLILFKSLWGAMVVSSSYVSILELEKFMRLNINVGPLSISLNF